MTGFDPDWLVPEWHAPGVGAVMTTRSGGCSRAPFDSMNVHAGGGDDAEAVARNRSLLSAAIGVAPVWLGQQHGIRVVRLTPSDAGPAAAVHEADASVTSDAGVACTIQVADCLPVLFAAPQGRAVGAAHAGWRGLSAGVLEATVDAVCAAAESDPPDLQAWVGAGIGPGRFEVGVDVLEAFGTDPADARNPAFVPGRPGKWIANLPLLARQRLGAAGVGAVSGGRWCTFEDPSRFYSFRRDRITGRMAAAVWIDRDR